MTRAADQARQAAGRSATLPMRLPAPATATPRHLNGATVLPQPRRHWAEFGMLVSGLAAAAVLLIVLVRPMLDGHPTDPTLVPPPHATPLVVKNFDSEPGQTLFIQVSGSTITAESRPAADVSETITVAAELDILNFMETQSSEAL